MEKPRKFGKRLKLEYMPESDSPIGANPHMKKETVEEIMQPEILSMTSHHDDHAMIVIRTKDGEELELRFDYDGEGMLTAHHGDHEYSIPVEVEYVESDDDDFEEKWELEDADEDDPRFQEDEHHMSTRDKYGMTDEGLSLAKHLKVGDKLKKINTSAPGTVTITKIDGNKVFVEDEALPGRLFQWAADGIEAEIKAGKLKLHTSVDEAAKKLSNKQKKNLDKNKNGRIDKEDFLLLQKEKSAKAVETFESFVNECWTPMEEGYNIAMSEEAKRAIKALCEEMLIKEAQMCDEDADPQHTYENYLSECGQWMTECMMNAATNLKIQ
jgi:hypothetical protein